MNAGFSNLFWLKQQLLPATMLANKQFDAAILALGLGFAGRIEKLCNRKLARQTGYQEILPADRANFLLSRFPLEQVTAIDLKTTDAKGWVSQDLTCFYLSLDLKNGMVLCHPGCDVGPYFAEVRFTYDGGFFWEQLESNDGGYPSQMPATATPLPEDIRAAWSLQCQQIWSQRDKLGIGLIDKPEAQAKLSEIKFSPEVTQMLQPHIRYQMT